MGLPIILLSAGTIKLANDINYLKSFLIIREDGTLFNEENTLTERIALVLIYKYKLINLNIIRDYITHYTIDKNKKYNTKSLDIVKDINTFMRDNGVNNKYTILKIISELSDFNKICEIELNKEYLTKIKEKLYNDIPLPIIKKVINTYFITYFKTVNDFFIRKIEYVVHRPIYTTSIVNEDAMVFVASCDSRCLIFDRVVKDYTLLIKNTAITCGHLLNSCNIDSNYHNTNVSVCIFRLATVDYHYCHAPIDCKILDIFTINNPALFSVQPNITNLYDVFLKNNRHIIKLITPHNTIFYMIIVGAIGIDCIEYINNNKYTKKIPRINTSYKRGEPICRFSLGGSTVILLFNKAIIKWNKSIVKNSLNNLETYVKVRSSYICRIN